MHRAAPESPSRLGLVLAERTRERDPHVDDLALRLVLALRGAHATHRRAFDPAQRDGLADHPFSALFLVWLLGAPSQGDLARALGVSRQATSVLLAGLAERGLILREGNAGDRRVRRVRLTAAGERTVAAQFRIQHRADRAWLAALTRDEQLTLAQLLERLSDRSVIP